MKKIFIVILAVAVALSFALDADAKKKKKKKKGGYAVEDVSNGGSITGKALFAGGSAPADETVTLTSEQSLCGDSYPAQKYVISGNKEIKDVVVYLEDIKAGKAMPTDTLVIDNLKCAFVPHTAIGYKGGKIVIKNSDPVFHNVHSYIKGKTIYNLGLPDPGSQVEKSMKKDGLMSVKCDSHPWMLGYVFIASNPYAALSGANGEYSITDIPEGSYKVKAWHEGFGEMDLGKVDVAAGAATTLNVEYK